MIYLNNNGLKTQVLFIGLNNNVKPNCDEFCYRYTVPTGMLPMCNLSCIVDQFCVNLMSERYGAKKKEIVKKEKVTERRRVMPRKIFSRQEGK